MTTSTKTEVLPELDEELDFELACEADDSCENVATWLALAPCPHHPFMCELHHAYAIMMARAHSKVLCAANNCNSAFCLCEVTWKPIPKSPKS